jgi:hypothetical protein
MLVGNGISSTTVPSSERTVAWGCIPKMSWMWWASSYAID